MGVFPGVLVSWHVFAHFCLVAICQRCNFGQGQGSLPILSCCVDCMSVLLKEFVSLHGRLFCNPLYGKSNTRVKYRSSIIKTIFLLNSHESPAFSLTLLLSLHSLHSATHPSFQWPHIPPEGHNSGIQSSRPSSLVHPVISRDLEELNAALEQARSLCSVRIQQQQQQQQQQCLPVTPAPPPQGLQVFGLANAEAQENSPAEINISTTTDFPVSALPFTGSSVFRYIEEEWFQR